MPLREAILELRGRIAALRGRLEHLGELTERVGGGSVHVLVEQVDKSALDAMGWAKRAAKATKAAIAAGTGHEAIRLALTEVQCALDRLRRREPKRLRGRRLAKDLDDLHMRPNVAKRLGQWARDASAALKTIRVAARAADRSLANGWRELASQPAPGRVTVKTVTVVG